MFGLKEFRRASFRLATALGLSVTLTPVVFADSPLRIVSGSFSDLSEEPIQLVQRQSPEIESSNLPPPLPMPPPAAERLRIPVLPLKKPEMKESEMKEPERKEEESEKPKSLSQTSESKTKKQASKQPNYSTTSIADLNIDITPKPSGKNSTLPQDMARRETDVKPVVAYGAVPQESFGISRLTADRFAYEPLYFQEANLERYGNHHGGLQPAISAARFFATIPALPYLATHYTPRQAYYWDWPYQTGREAPHVRELPPLRLKPATVESASIAALILLFP